MYKLGNIAYIFVFATAVYAGRITNKEGYYSGKENLGIVDGEEINNATYYPWSVSIQTNETGVGTHPHRCSGFIVTTEDKDGRAWVATSANCIKENNIGTSGAWKVYAGGVQNNERCFWPKKCKRASIAEIHTHINFSSNTFENDIALLNLSTSFTKNDFITEIEMQKRDEPLPAGTPLHITGFGKTMQNPFNNNNKLNHGIVAIWDLNQCKAALDLFNDRPIKDTNYCAGQWQGKNGEWIGSCTDKGDLGGPLFTCRGELRDVAECTPDHHGLGWTVEGIASWTTNPCGYNFPGVYTKIDEYEEWIRSTIPFKNPTTENPTTTPVATTTATNEGPTTTPLATTEKTEEASTTMESTTIITEGSTTTPVTGPTTTPVATTAKTEEASTTMESTTIITEGSTTTAVTGPTTTPIATTTKTEEASTTLETTTIITEGTITTPVTGQTTTL